MAIVLYTLTAISLGWLALFLAGKKVGKIWLMVLGVAPVVLIYVLNPEFRVYSFHSFMHAGITYQILNGNVPPTDPLLAGHAAAYPWAAHLIAAGLSRVFNITPFLSIAVMNVASLALAMALIYRISKMLVDDERANVLSVVVSIYGITVANPSLLRLLSVKLPTEFRGVPILLKFITINVLPIGLVCFLLFVYLVLKLEISRRTSLVAPLVLVALLGVGFTYPAFLPGIAVSLGLAWILTLALFRRETLRWSLRTLVSTVLALAATALIVRPYLALTGAGTVGQMQILAKQMVLANAVKYFVVTLPILVIIAANLRAFRQVNPRALAFLVIVVVATAAAYLAIHVPLDNEYKFLLLSTVTLGILGGVAFAELARRLKGYRTIAVFVLLALFLFPSFRFVKLKMVQERAGRPSKAFVERGRSIHSTDPEDDQFYQWIKANTGPKSVFVDQELDIPVLAERPLLIGLGKREPGQQKGFGPVDMILRFQSGYPASLLETRRRIVEKIYAADKQLTDAEVSELLGLPGDLYVVWRAKGQDRAFDNPAFQEVFSSQAGNYKIYQFKLPGK
jgi:hypothetical protein